MEILYIIFGILTVIVNVLVYYLCYILCGISNTFSTIFAWIVAVLFAFVTNRKIVFGKCESHRLLFEILSFFGCRLSTGLIDLLIMMISVDVLHWNTIVWKIISNAISTVLNYIASKYFIFKKEDVDAIKK